MSSTADPLDLIHPFKDLRLDVDKIQVDRSYQRDPSMRMVDGIADDWNAVASELILVSDRGVRPEGSEVLGGLFIINGQHRLRAARKLGHKKISARVIDLSDAEDPAAIEAGYRLQTNVRLGDRNHERFKAQLRAGNEESWAIVRMLEHFDTEVNMVPTNEMGINCITCIELIYRVDEGALLRDTLEIIQSAVKVVGGKNVNAGFLKGLAWWIEKHAMDADRSRIIEKIQVMGVRGVESRARAMQSTYAGTMWLNYYRALIDLYNEKLTPKSRLELSTRGQAAFRPRTTMAGAPTDSNLGDSSTHWGRG